MPTSGQQQTPWVSAADQGCKCPNRVNRAHWPTKEHNKQMQNFCIFPAHAKNDLKWHQMGPGGFFPTHPDLADILGRTDLDFEIFSFWDFPDPKFLDFQVPRSPNSLISRFPDFQTPPPADPDELSDPNLTPLPTHPGIKYVARNPCCDHPKNLPYIHVCHYICK